VAAGLQQHVLVVQAIVERLVQPRVVVPVVALQTLRSVEVDHVDLARVRHAGEMLGDLVDQRRIHIEHVIAVRAHEVPDRGTGLVR